MNLCTWCVAELGRPSSVVQIHYPDPEHGGPDRDEHAPGGRWYDSQYGRTPRKVELILEALEHGWQVVLNGGFLVEPPVATWHGDPACAAHLLEQIDLYRAPRTVRMAQWR